MSAVYVSMSTCWATYADGRPLVGPNADFTVLDERIDALTVEQLEEISQADTQNSLADLGETAADGDPDDDFAARAPGPDADRAYTERGATELRNQLRAAVRRLANDAITRDEDDAEFSFDGRRWWVASGGFSHGDAPTGAYSDIALLDLADIMTAPLDGPTFADVPVMAATVVVLDEIADVLRSAVRGANLPQDVLAHVERELEDARNNVAGAAATFRSALDRVGVERANAAWALFEEETRKHA